MIDVSPLVPEARPIVREAARIYLEHTRPWFIGLLAHGSALKGGFIRGCSDIDLQLYLQDAAFAEDANLPLQVQFGISRDLSKIDPAPFQYIQCYALPPHRTPPPDPGSLGPIRGSYRMLMGELPVLEATYAEVLSNARQSLANLQPIRSYVPHGLLQRGGQRLERAVRLMCTDVWPTLYHVLTLQEDSMAVWSLPKNEAIGMLSDGEPLGKEIRRFYHVVQVYYGGDRSIEQALAVIDRGVRFMRTAKEWYRAQFP